MNLLTSSQKLAIGVFAHSPLQKKFYWTGGTLLAFHYLKHRRSLDLDFFSDVEFRLDEITPFVQRFKEEGGFRGVKYQKVFDRYEFLFENRESLRVEFVYYDHQKKRLGERGELLGVCIDSLEDIAANKMMSYFDRREPKDLFDLYFLLTKTSFTPQKLLNLVQKKFGIEFDESSFWSEAFKVLPLLSELKPLMLESNETKKDALLQKIERYFKDKSFEFLQRNLQ